jgi:HAD superfamily hydrolase (TIGR01509 family)
LSTTAVIFDMDGVLVDTEPFYFKSNNELFRELGFSVNAEDYAHFVGSSAQKMWTILKKRFHLPHSVDDLIEKEYRVHTQKIASMETLEPIAGIKNLLYGLSAASLPLAIASSSPRAVIELTLDKSGLDAYFPVRVSGEDVISGKPHPDIFLKAAALLRIPPQNCLVIEDSPRGVTGAHSAGMKAVGFRNPNSGEQDLSQADCIVDSFSASARETILRLCGIVPVE